MKKNCKVKKPTIWSYIGSFFLWFFLVAVVSVLIYGYLFPKTKAVVNPICICVIAVLITLRKHIIRICKKVVVMAKQSCEAKDTQFEKSVIIATPCPTSLVVSPYPQNVSIGTQLLDIDLMEGHDFEYWCAGLLRKNGFTNVVVTQGSGDQGVDILAQKDDIRYAIQCKCYSKDLGNTPVQEVAAGKMMPEYHCQIGAVMTNRYFTKGARDLAAATGTLLWDRDWIIAHIADNPSSYFSHQQNAALSADESDPLFFAAVDVVLKTSQASVSIIQRHLGLGYARAARIIDEMELQGIIGPFSGSAPRKILIKEEQWAKIKNRPGTPTPKWSVKSL